MTFYCPPDPGAYDRKCSDGQLVGIGWLMIGNNGLGHQEVICRIFTVIKKGSLFCFHKLKGSRTDIQ